MSTDLSSAAPKGRWSIVSRLTIWYTVSAVGMLFLATAFLYGLMATNLREEDEEFLVNEIDTLRAILLTHPAEGEALNVEVELEAATRPFAKFYARILTESGQVVIQTRGMETLLPGPEEFAAPVGPDETLERGVVWNASDKRFFLLGSALARLGAAGSGRRLIQLALDVTQEQLMLARYRRWLGLVLFCGILFSAAAGGWIARRSMRPLEEITAATQRITATQLNERISPRSWPKELTALATAFDQMLGRLEESFSRLCQFSADLAHELRTPINNMMGEAEVALSRSRTQEDYRQVLESSLEESNRLARMIDSLLFLARAENAETEIQRAALEAEDEMRAVLDFYENLAEEQGVKLETSGRASLQADQILLRRVLGNLISNALDYTPRGGTIRVRACRRPDDWVEIRVSDTGSGIPSKHLFRIFDRFYRADPARTRHTQGTGLGLAIVKSIMTLHGGSVSVESEEGRGATFILHFPPSGPSGGIRFEPRNRPGGSGGAGVT